MTKQEVNKLLALMKANYSYAFKTMSQQDKYLLLNTWTFALQDLNADIVMIAVMQLISVSKWLPTVAEIRSVRTWGGRRPSVNSQTIPRSGSENW